MYELIIE